jgi:hypothetical protein
MRGDAPPLALRAASHFEAAFDVMRGAAEQAQHDLADWWAAALP